MPFDYSDSDTAPFDYELIPAGEVALVRMLIRAGDTGEDGVCKRSKEGTSSYLDAEFVLLDGKYARQKFWQILMITGETSGQMQMVDKSQAIRKAILDSAYGIRPDDKTAEARAKRSKNLVDFDGIKFQAKIGIEKGKKRDNSTEMFRDKNVLDGVVTCDKPGYRGPFDQNPSPSNSPPSSPAPATPVTKPAWAQG